MYRSPYRPTGDRDTGDWDGSPPQGEAVKWLAGVVLPAALAVYGAVDVVRRSAWLPAGGRVGGGGGMWLQGADAVALGVAIIGIAVFAHFHCFWGNVARLEAWAAPGKVAGLVGFIGGLGYVLVHLGIYGR